MFASPAPSATRARRAAQPVTRQTQPARRASAAIRAGTSRLTTPAIRASHGSPSEDQDMQSEALFGTVTAPEATGVPTYVKTPELSVTFNGHFPEEVRRTLGSSGKFLFNRNSGDIVDGWFRGTQKCIYWLIRLYYWVRVPSHLRHLFCMESDQGKHVPLQPRLILPSFLENSRVSHLLHLPRTRTTR